MNFWQRTIALSKDTKGNSLPAYALRRSVDEGHFIFITLMKFAVAKISEVRKFFRKMYEI